MSFLRGGVVLIVWLLWGINTGRDGMDEVRWFHGERAVIYARAGRLGWRRSRGLREGSE